MAYRDVILAEASLQSYWEMDEGLGNITDSEGAVTGTTLGNNTYSQTGLIPVGSAILIDPGADSGACGFDMGNVYGFTGTSAFTVEAWVKPAILDAAGRQIAGKEDVTGTNWGWWVVYTSTNISVRRRDATINNTLNFAHTMSVGGIYHIVATFDGTNIRAYQDGAEIGTAQASAASILSHTAPFRVGSHSQGGNRLRGTIDEIAVYNVALSLSSIQSHYNAAVAVQTLLPDADLAAGGWTTSPLFSKIADSSDATFITNTAS
jgi:hypothetical protein